MIKRTSKFTSPQNQINLIYLYVRILFGDHSPLLIRVSGIEVKSSNMVEKLEKLVNL